MAGLEAMCAVGLLIEQRVGVVVEAFDISAGQQQKRIAGAAEIEIGDAIVVDAAIVAGRDGGFGG